MDVADPAPPPARGRVARQRLVPCPGCSLPHVVCMCDELPQLVTRTRVVVVMHRRETYRTSNTGRLAVKVLASAACAVRGGKEPRAAPTDLGARRLVLFPSDEARTLTAADAGDGAGETVLIVPDGTWSQAQRVLRREPCAQGAEIVRLPPCAPTRYALRRNTREGALCTFEAVAAALGVLEGPEVEARLLACFDTFQARALSVRGRRSVLEKPAIPDE